MHKNILNWTISFHTWNRKRDVSPGIIFTKPLIVICAWHNNASIGSNKKYTPIEWLAEHQPNRKLSTTTDNSGLDKGIRLDKWTYNF